MPEDKPQTDSRINWKNILIGVIIGAILIGGGVGLYYLLFQPKSLEPTVTTTKKATPSAKQSTPSAQKDETAGWKTYEGKLIKVRFQTLCWTYTSRNTSP